MKLLLTALAAILFIHLQAQTVKDSSDVMTTEGELDISEYHGIIRDQATNAPLSYANIYVLSKQKGTVSNEIGHFTIDISDMETTDTLRFQYIGFKTRNLTLGQLDTTSVVYLEEEIINLSETIVFGSTPNVRSIVKNVLIYQDSNYRKTTSKRQTFIREREDVDISDFTLTYKKSTIDELDREVIQTIEDRTPKFVTSYTDFLGYFYYNKNRDDSIKQKLDPVRMVSLEEEYLEDLNQLETLFEGILAETGEDEYWKVKSGVFGSKIDIEEDSLGMKMDSIRENRRKTSSHASYVNYQLSYSRLQDKKQWEFLHNTSKYKYTLIGGTRVNGEDAYIIDFEPNRSGLYIGRMFITMQTYALIRADYAYAPEKTGRDIHLLGLGYTETQFSGSIYFERKDNNYRLKYLSNKFGYEASVDRNLALMKKRKRWLFDKKEKELKVGVKLAIKAEESLELLVLDEIEITKNQFAAFTQPEYIEVIYVDQFDDDLWRGFSIIEPTQQMKEYKKQEVNNTF